MTLPLWPEPAGPSAPPPNQVRRLTLARLAGEIARSLSEVGRVAVEGEVYRPTVSKGGWLFFTLKDRAAQMPVVVPGRFVRRCRVVNGERALVVGALKWSNDRGQLQLEADEVTPVGEGAVAALIAETRQRLQAEGLLERPRRRLPVLPAVIGVLCGADAAVRRDIESVVAERFPGYPLRVEETTVSGPGAALCIIEGLARLAVSPGVDVIVLARGGGDATSLLPWSDEEVCRAVAACPVPVVSAIGHEADRPLCDEVADLRCGTPSIAAHHVVPERAALVERAAGLFAGAAQQWRAHRQSAVGRLAATRTEGALAAGSARARQRLVHGGQRLRMTSPAVGVRSGRHRLAACPWQVVVPTRTGYQRARLDALGRHAEALSPQHVLGRGFAVVRRADGTVVRHPGQVGTGEVLNLALAGGVMEAVAAPTPAEAPTVAGGRVDATSSATSAALRTPSSPKGPAVLSAGRHKGRGQ